VTNVLQLSRRLGVIDNTHACMAKSVDKTCRASADEWLCNCEYRMWQMADGYNAVLKSLAEVHSRSLSILDGAPLRLQGQHSRAAQQLPKMRGNSSNFG
jgi:hypothetical protein